MHVDESCENTDRELWREREGDYYADSILVTRFGGIGINCGGLVYVKSVRDWHALAARLAECESLLRLMTVEMDPQPNDFRLVDDYFRRTDSADAGLADWRCRCGWINIAANDRCDACTLDRPTSTVSVVKGPPASS